MAQNVLCPFFLAVFKMAQHIAYQNLSLRRFGLKRLKSIGAVLKNLKRL